MKLSLMKINNFLKFFVILFVILTTGSDYFANRHMMPTMFVFFAACILLFFINNCAFNKKVFRRVFLFAILFFVDTIVTIKNGFNTNDVIILIMKFICIIVIVTDTSLDEFIDKYIKCVYYISIISLICFSLLSLGVKSLPFEQIYPRTGDTSVLCTFYYTIGWGTFFGRNAGLFWEPGVFQIILNIAIFFRLSMEDVKIDRYLVIFIISVLTTMSTTGYVCLLLNLLYFIINTTRLKHKWRYIIVIIISGLAIFFLDKYTGTLTNKIVNQSGSYVTRNLDTAIGYEVSLMHPFFGYGAFNTIASKALVLKGVRNISNGLAGFLIMNGYPIVILYLIFTFNSIFRICNRKIVPTVIIFIMFLAFFNTEYVMPLTLFWLFCYFDIMKKRKINIRID